jgi:MFS family permease
MMPLYFVFSVTLLGFTYLSATRVVLSLYALKLGAGPFAVGALAATIYVFPLLLSWVVGTLADRWGSRWLLFAAMVCGSVGALLPYLFHNLPALFAAAALAGLLLALYNVIVQNLVGLLSKPEKRTQNFSNFSLVGATSNFIGPLLAGYSIDHAGHALTSLYIMVLPVAAVALIARWGGILPGGSGQKVTRPTGIIKSFTERETLQMLGISSLMQAGNDFFQFYIPIYGHSIALSALEIGSVLATFAVAAFLVRLVMPRLIAWRSEEMLLAYCFYVGAASFALIPFFKSALVLALVSFLFGLGMGCGQPLTLMLMFSRSPVGRSGETLGLRLTANNFVRTSGPAVFGMIGSAMGLFPVFWLNALLMGSGAWLTWAATGKKKR